MTVLNKNHNIQRLKFLGVFKYFKKYCFVRNNWISSATLLLSARVARHQKNGRAPAPSIQRWFVVYSAVCIAEVEAGAVSWASKFPLKFPAIAVRQQLLWPSLALCELILWARFLGFEWSFWLLSCKRLIYDLRYNRLCIGINHESNYIKTRSCSKGENRGIE